MSPLPRIPAQGDAARLEQLGTGLKQTNGTSGPVIQRTPAGRPQGSGTPTAAGTPAVPEEFKGVAKQLASAEVNRTSWAAIADYWEGVFAESPTPFIRQMRDMAAQMADEHDRNFTMTAARVYNTTPNAEY